MAGKNSEQGGSAPPAPDNSGNSQASQVMNHLSDTESANPKSARVVEETDQLLAHAKATATADDNTAKANPIASTRMNFTNINAKHVPTVKAKIDAYLEEKKQRAAALAAEEEPAPRSRVDTKKVRNTWAVFKSFVLCTIIYLNLGSTRTLYYCTSNTNITCVPHAYPTHLGTSKILSYEYLAFKNLTDYTTALHRVVSYPKPIKLGPTGSSTKRCGAVKKSKYIKNPKFKNNFQKIKIFKNFKSITNMTARALAITFKCNNFLPIKIGQEKIEIFTKLFDINLKMAMFKTAIRTTIGRTNQKLGQENHFLQKLRREIDKYMQRRENNASTTMALGGQSLNPNKQH
jgi:hypothetical protein